MAFDVEKELDSIQNNLKNTNQGLKPAPQKRTTSATGRPATKAKKPAAQRKKKAAVEKDGYYTGEVYFASKRPTANTGTTSYQRPQQINKQFKNYQGKGKRSTKDIFEKLKKMGNKGIAIYVAMLVLFSALLSIYTMSFVNDILALNRSEETITVTIPENASTGKVISILKKNKLIKHKYMCKMFMVATANLRGEKTYLSGVYYLTPSMGLEKMLISCQEVQTNDTVTVTIPEGYSIDQIATKLAKAGVCTADEFYKNLKQAVFNYGFVNEIENKNARYNYLEGYLYPDTYEFYVEENASSVINTLLKNFKVKWTDEYQARATELNMTVDEVITMASIIQKEAGDSDQMPIIASIFFNRLNSSSFRCLQSDATTVYVEKYIKPNVSEGEASTFASKYSTYKCVGLPVGPICCPGDDAIRAVLWPANTDYYFFCHDKRGNMYTAKTEAEHSANYYSTLTN